MNLNSISRVRKIISNIAKDEAIKIVNDLEKCKTSDEIEQFVSEKFLEKWKHLFDSNNLPRINTASN
jgi:phosphoenolpyruvate-protein kinase (PTS system EI component)